MLTPVSDEQKDNLRVLAILATHYCKALTAALEQSVLKEETKEAVNAR